MKYMVLLLAILAGVWLIRRNQSRREQLRAREATAPAAKRLPVTLPMVSCAHCGMHVPIHDSVAGQGDARYCSRAHQRAQESAS